MICYFMLLLSQTVSRQVYTIISSQIRSDPNKDVTYLTLTKDNFDIAFSTQILDSIIPDEKANEYFSANLYLTSMD